MAWVRIPGDKKRRYRNTETGEEISRRQYDERIGRLAKQGLKSNEAQAAKNRKENPKEQLARPARGRRKLDVTEPEQREAILEQRLQLREQKEQTERVQKKIRSIKNKAARRPGISDRLLKPGTQSRRVAVEFSLEGYAEAVREAQGSHIAMYGVGVIGVHEITGAQLEIWVQLSRFRAMRDISMPFTESDWQKVLSAVNEKSYFVPVAGFVHFAFGIEYAKKRKEASVRQKRKQAFGNSVRRVGH